MSGVLNSPTAGDKYFDLQQKLELNVSRFAAAKAYQATQLVRRLRFDDAGALRPAEEFGQLARAALNAFNRYQAAEYNTAVARARTARQWVDFTAGKLNNELFPNIKWIPSRSAVKREEHIQFYNKVWAKSDPFWEHNQPGNLWNCKCDWIETDEPVSGEAHDVKPAKGLAGNPAKTGKIFSDDASYFTKKALKNIEDIDFTDAKSKLKISVMADINEVGDNIRTGRVLLNNHDITLAIRKHLIAPNLKNPEYTLDSMKADAKRVDKWVVVNAFRNAIKQGAKVVIVDLYKQYNRLGGNKERLINVRELTKNIARRIEDLKSGRLDRCYVVWGNKSLEITRQLFKDAEKAGVEVRQMLEERLRTLL